MIDLLDVEGGNPFEEHPQLRSIWPAELHAIAEEATVETVNDMPRGDIGGLYLIAKDGQVIGITGYFYVDSVDEPYLRWHGVVPAERGKGYSRRALQLLIANIKSKIPHAKGLTELVPQTQTDYGVGIGRHFAKLGFVESGEKEMYEWSPHAWQPVRLDLAEVA
jgi:GNAT superfamily N-acetyltransferase